MIRRYFQCIEKIYEEYMIKQINNILYDAVNDILHQQYEHKQYIRFHNIDVPAIHRNCIVDIKTC